MLVEAVVTLKPGWHLPGNAPHNMKQNAVLPGRYAHKKKLPLDFFNSLQA
jgi:hypothetical protein